MYRSGATRGACAGNRHMTGAFKNYHELEEPFSLRFYHPNFIFSLSAPQIRSPYTHTLSEHQNQKLTTKRKVRMLWCWKRSVCTSFPAARCRRGCTPAGRSCRSLLSSWAAPPSPALPLRVQKTVYDGPRQLLSGSDCCLSEFLKQNRKNLLHLFKILFIHSSQSTLPNREIKKLSLYNSNCNWKKEQILLWDDSSHHSDNFFSVII